jgi:hypothetical protein
LKQNLTFFKPVRWAKKNKRTMRKAQAKKLPLAPDPKFQDKLVTRFVNNFWFFTNGHLPLPSKKIR